RELELLGERLGLLRIGERLAERGIGAHVPASERRLLEERLREELRSVARDGGLFVDARIDRVAALPAKARLGTDRISAERAGAGAHASTRDDTPVMRNRGARLRPRFRVERQRAPRRSG